MPTHDFPDTLYLPDRAKLAINCFTGCLNPAEDSLPYCLMDISGERPRMRHTQFDWSDHASRVIDGLILARALGATDQGGEALGNLLPLFWRGFGDDGLHYTPDNDWSFRHANMHYQRSVLNALLALALGHDSDQAAEQARRLAYGLDDIAIAREGFKYFPAVERMPEGWPRGDWGILGFGVDPANTSGRLLFGLTRLYELLNDDRVAALARGFARHVTHHSSAYTPDGGFATGMEFREGHFHSRAVTMLGVVRLGYSLGDSELVGWGRNVFEQARSYGTTFGWFPERLVRSAAHGCETCAIVDMMETAIWLAKSGYTQYWADAERFLRNHLVESQLTNVDWCVACDEEHGADKWETTVNVAERVLGGFAGWSQPNDFVSKVMHEWDLYTCCCAQGVRGLFNAWNNTVSISGDRISVNLLLNHHSDAVDVRSWLPHAGKVAVTPRQDSVIRIRVPEWLDARTLSAAEDGQAVELIQPVPLFAQTPMVQAGRTVTFTFPLAEFARTETVLDVDYRTYWRGDTVMQIHPQGPRAPLYQRHPAPTDIIVSRDVPDITFVL